MDMQLPVSNQALFFDYMTASAFSRSSLFKEASAEVLQKFYN